jgi:hypothetical protein
MVALAAVTIGAHRRQPSPTCAIDAFSADLGDSPHPVQLPGDGVGSKKRTIYHFRDGVGGVSSLDLKLE